MAERRDAGTRPCAGRARRPPCSSRIIAHIAADQEFRSLSVNWITNYVRPKINSMLGRREVPENLWIKCPETRRDGLPHATSRTTSGSFRAPAIHMKMPAKARLKDLFDGGSLRGLPQPKVASGSAEVPRSKKYADRLQGQPRQDRAGGHDPCRRRHASRACKLVAVVQEFNFMGGSLGMAAGEAIVKAFEARDRRRSARWSCSRPPAARACRKASCR